MDSSRGRAAGFCLVNRQRHVWGTDLTINRKGYGGAKQLALCVQCRRVLRYTVYTMRGNHPEYEHRDDAAAIFENFKTAERMADEERNARRAAHASKEE